MEDEGSKGITRRDFLKGAAATAGTALLAGCGKKSVGQEQLAASGPERQKYVPLPLSPEFRGKMELGRRLREKYMSPALEGDLNRLALGDLPLNSDPGIQRIRQWRENELGRQPDSQQLRLKVISERFALVLGYLDINDFSQKGQRYGNNKDAKGNEIYVCNIRAIDLIRALFGHQGADDPIALTMLVEGNDLRPNPMTADQISWAMKKYGGRFDKIYHFLSSDRADKWFKGAEAQRRGWRPVKTLAGLRAALDNGQLVVGVTKKTWLDKTGEVAHMFVLGPDYNGLGTNIVLSQGTRNIGAEAVNLSGARKHFLERYQQVYPQKSKYDFFTLEWM